MDNTTRNMWNDEAGDFLQQPIASLARVNNSWPTHDLNPLMGGAVLAERQTAQTA